ncbi:MAG: OsmC family protein [Myxococcaceae bacterium]
MTTAPEIVIRLAGGRRVDALVRGHTVHTDQPVANGGEDTAPSPFELFLASIGTCAGIFVQGFCAKRGIPFEDIRIVEHPLVDEKGALVRLELDLQLPVDFPEKYRPALLRVVEECSVKRSIAAQPEIKVNTSVKAGRTAE